MNSATLLYVLMGGVTLRLDTSGMQLYSAPDENTHSNDPFALGGMDSFVRWPVINPAAETRDWGPC